MPLTLDWQEIALRLGLAVIAGTLIGIDRGEHGRPAGLRTTLLVCLAATIAMISANLLLATAGKRSDSFAVLDLMRLPLGILTGMGFIGGGAILRRDGLVIGVTTAATLWFVTVMGLCFGAGQLTLGITTLVLGMFVLSGLKWVESQMKQDHHGRLVVTIDGDEPIQDEIDRRASSSGYRLKIASATYDESTKQRTLEFRLRWRAPAKTQTLPPFMEALSKNSHVRNVRWENAPGD